MCISSEQLSSYSASLTQKEKYKLTILRNKVQRRVLGYKKDKLTTGRITFHNATLLNYSQISDMIWVDWQHVPGRYKMLIQKWQETDDLGALGIQVKEIIFNFKKEGGNVWTGINQLRTGSKNCFYEQKNKPLGSTQSENLNIY